MTWLLYLLFSIGLGALLLIKPDHEKHPTVYYTFIAGSAALLLAVSSTLIAYGASPRKSGTVAFVGSEVSASRLQDAATMVGAGIVTALVAGALIAAVQRWHDHERQSGM